METRIWLNIFFSPALSAPQPLPRSGEVFSEVVASAAVEGSGVVIKD